MMIFWFYKASKTEALHRQGAIFYKNFLIKSVNTSLGQVLCVRPGKYSVMVIGRGLSRSLFGKICMGQGGEVRHEGFSFYGPRESDEGADSDLIYI